MSSESVTTPQKSLFFYTSWDSSLCFAQTNDTTETVKIADTFYVIPLNNTDSFQIKDNSSIPRLESLEERFGFKLYF